MSIFIAWTSCLLGCPIKDQHLFENFPTLPNTLHDEASTCKKDKWCKYVCFSCTIIKALLSCANTKMSKIQRHTTRPPHYLFIHIHKNIPMWVDQVKLEASRFLSSAFLISSSSLWFCISVAMSCLLIRYQSESYLPAHSYGERLLSDNYEWKNPKPLSHTWRNGGTS